MIKHRDIYEYLNALAPYQDAESWDPTGPTFGWLDDQTTNCIVSLDLTTDAYNLALKNKSTLIITHHPFLFAPIQSILSDNLEQKLILDLIKNRISVISCHTNLDAAIEGVATTFLQAALDPDSYNENFKILIPHTEKPEVGHGRYVILKDGQKLSYLLKQMENNLKTSIQVNTDHDKTVKKIVFTPGSFDESWIPELEKLNVELLVTGEIKHHVTVMLKERGIALFAAGHGASEQTVIPFLAKQLTGKFSDINFVENPGINYNKLKSE